MKTLPNDSKMRYHYPISSGCIAYFPAALAGVAKHSYIGGAKYNDGALVHLRYISNNHMDCVGRHMLDLQDLLAAKERGTTHVSTYVYNFEDQEEQLIDLPINEAILIECNAMCWRSLALSQELHERLGKAPLAPAARTEPPPAKVTPIKLLSFGKNKVAVVKALREINGYSLKDAVDLVNGVPSMVEYRASHFSRAKAVLRLVEAGADAT
jgi:ribosomal protein L7/L12